MPAPEEILTKLRAIDLLSLPEVLAQFFAAFPGANAAFSTSFSLEDQAITHLLATAKMPVRIFTLDTGRHFPETYRTLDATRERYGLDIEVFFPKTDAIQNLLHKKGAYSFYTSLENRLECCHVRKVEPLERALKNVSLWLTGIRHAHSPERAHLPYFEIDDTHHLVKFHPLLAWNDSELKSFIDANNIPYNRLQDKGYLSIGCEPCTRPVEPGGDMRSGRWWWENQDKKECGLHIHK